MNVQVKAAAALFLIAGSLGVIGYDIRYLRSGERHQEDLYGGGSDALEGTREAPPWGGIDPVEPSDAGAVESGEAEAARPRSDSSSAPHSAGQCFSNRAAFEEEMGRLHLSGIAEGKDRSAALVVGWILHAGDLVPGCGARVVEIGRDFVVFEAPGCGRLTKSIEVLDLSPEPLRPAADAATGD
jgi:hypothetical protein